MSIKIRGLMTIPLAALAMPAAAQTLPTGGSIVQGAGSVAVNGAQMVVKQDSARMVADWHSFSIGAGNAVRFVQPSANAVALNRVTGGDPSAILGSLTANGHVYLQNPNGVLFAPGAQVSVGSLVATSLDVDAQAFMAGRLQLSGDASRGEVRNEGSLVTTEGGHVVLVAPQVINTGSIATPGGTTALVAGSAVTIDPTGAGLLTISVPAAAVNARLEQSGSITADGGAVRLAVATADAALGTVMQVGGVVRARSIEQRGGEIVLAGGDSGVVRVDGTLDAAGGDAATGGVVKVLGERVALLGQARIDASGGQGGGTVLVGGNYQGRGAEPNARDTYVGAGVVIDASSTRRGDGGTAVVWSDHATAYAGRITARGGAEGGSGGLVEVSGKQTLAFDGEVDVRAPRGLAGGLLLDPDSIEIGSVADVNADNAFGDDLVGPDMLFDAVGGPSYITANRVASLLATGDVTLQATSSIDVIEPLTVAPGGAASTLTLNSATIGIAQPMTLNNTSLLIDTGSVTGISFINVTADISSLRTVSFTTPQLLLYANLAARDVLLTTRVPGGGGSFSLHIEQLSGAGITADSLTVESLPGSFLGIQLNGPNRIGSLVLQNVVQTQVNVDNAPGTPLAVRGSAESFTLNTNTGVTQSGPLNVVFGTIINATSSDPLTGVVDLSNTGNTFGDDIDFTVGSSVSLAATGPLSVIGTAGRDITLLSTNDAVDLAGNILSGTAGVASTIRITGRYFDNSSNASVSTQSGGRYLIRSADHTLDDPGSLQVGTGAGDINYVVYGGDTTDPGAGNGYYTNRTASIAGSPSNAPALSYVYNGSPNFAFAQTLPGGTLVEAGGGANYSLDSYAVNSTVVFSDKNVGIDKGYTVAADGNASATSAGIAFYGVDYTGFVRPAGAGSVSEITPLGITSGGITGVDRVYNGLSAVAVNAGAATLAGVLAGDAVTLDAAGAVGFMSDKTVGTAKGVAVSGLALGGADGGNYVVTDASNATVTITPRALTSTGLLAIDRVYDGSTVVTADVSGANLGGPIVPDDIVSVGSATGTMADKHVGANKAVTMNNVVLAGNDAANYTVVDASTATVDITPRTVIATGVNGVNRVYDGTTVVGVDTSGAALVNAVAGDDIALDASTATGSMADKNAGTGKAVTITGVTLAGADAGNYSFSNSSAPTVDIATLLLTPVGIGAVDRVSDGSTGITLATGGAGLLGIVPGDAVSLDTRAASGSVASPDAGVQPVSVAGLVLTGPDAANYSVASAALNPRGAPLAVRLMTPGQAAFETVRHRQYLQGVSDAQEPFRRAMAEALAAGFGKENIRKQLTRGLVFETGLASPAVDDIDSAARPEPCSAGAAADGKALACGQ